MHRTTGTQTEVSAETARAWDALVRQHSSRVFQHAYRLAGNRVDAEDITQEVLARALRSPQDGVAGAAERWFHRVTTNVFVDMVRRRRRFRSVPIEERPWTREPVDGAPDPSDAAMQQVLEPDVSAALATLAPVFREAVLLHDVHGLSYAEIGAVVDAKPGTVRSRIHRGRALLRRALAHRAPRDGRARHSGPIDEGPLSDGPLSDGPVAPVGTSGTMAG